MSYIKEHDNQKYVNLAINHQEQERKDMDNFEKINQKSLDDLLKDKWQPITTIGYNGIILGRMGERIVYDIVTQEITTRYSTNLETKEIKR